MATGSFDEALDDAVKLGLIEIVGMTPDGQWLYASTPKAIEILKQKQSFIEFSEALEKLQKEIESE